VDHHNLCPGCMENKGAAKTCPYCGLPAGAGPESALHLPPGTILQDKYLLGRALGQGGFGITYLAWDLNLNLKLAIKEYLPLDMASRASGQTEISVYKKEFAGSFQYGLEKYLEEARTLARFAGHPSIVWVRDFFKANGTAYIVMEYIEGVTLKGYLQDKQEPLPFEQAMTIFMPVIDALKEVHAEGILHRDISPDNLLISKRGRVVLIDFGAARQAIGEQSRSLSVIMKPGFSPEEQYHSHGKQGPWTDIYAVAASLYCTITGTVPPESLSRLSEDTLEPPSQLGVKIGPPLERVLLKAMAVRAKDRYQTVEDFQAALLASGQGSDAKETYADTGVAKSIGRSAGKQNMPEKISAMIEKEPDHRGKAGSAKDSLSLTINKKSIKVAGVAIISLLLLYGGFSFGFRMFGSRTVIDPTLISTLDVDYYIDFDNGTIPIGELPIGSRVVDPGWEWEFRTGPGYTRETGDETKPVKWIVVAKDHYGGLESHVTLLSEELIGRNSFSVDNSNHWGESNLRNWLNSAGFYQAISRNFRSDMLTTTLPSREWENGTAYSTSDNVFIPSTTELGDTTNRYTYQIGKVYPYFNGAHYAKRVAMIGDTARYYWTRSPDSSNSNIVRHVWGTGNFYYESHATYGTCGVRPALNLKADTLVSEIGD
jgi:serine/threonine protein kinase